MGIAAAEQMLPRQGGLGKRNVLDRDALLLHTKRLCKLILASITLAQKLSNFAPGDRRCDKRYRPDDKRKKVHCLADVITDAVGVIHLFLFPPLRMILIIPDAHQEQQRNYDDPECFHTVFAVG